MPPPVFDIERLGPSERPSPLQCDGQTFCFVDDAEQVLYDIRLSGAAPAAPAGDAGAPPRLEAAGPRARIYFDPARCRAGVVTCGGLCPGLNDVIRGLTMGLHYLYRVPSIYGFRYGYQGMNPACGHPPIRLTPETVDNIHEMGGSILASSRGDQDPAVIVDCLQQMGINLLFTIGGDGTMNGALAIIAEIKRRNAEIAVVGIPKTIDNDISYLDASFGFTTAYSTAVAILDSAHTEANGAPRGIGLVKLMGRHSGFIACYAALASTDVNFVLIPESPFELEGPGGLYAALEERLDRRGHAVVVVAEGAGQDWLPGGAHPGVDASGNRRLLDIGPALRDGLDNHFRKIGKPVNLKYIDPSYVIRSVPAQPIDSVYCGQLARHAAHAAMTGRTAMIVGRAHGQFVHIPMATAISTRQKIDPKGPVWRAVLEMTGQPPLVNP